MKKKLIIAVLMVATLLSGCYPKETQKIENTSNNSQLVENEEDYQIPDLKVYLGMNYNKLTKAQVEELELIYEELNNFEFGEDEESDYQYQGLWEPLDAALLKFGIDRPFLNQEQYIKSIKEQIEKADYKKMMELNKKIEKINQELEELMADEILEEIYDTEERLSDLSKELGNLFDENGMNPDEVITQIENKSVHLALFDIVEGEIQLSEKSLKKAKDLSQEDLEVYQKLWAHMKEIIPSDYMDKLSKFEINTDGFENVMAHVVPENMDASKWRIAIDLNDAIKADQTYNDELDNTIIHEFAHIVTLNNDQMLPLQSDYSKTYTIDEGSLKKEAYLNQFYELFWTDLIEEQEALNDATYTEEEIYGNMLGFYEKYENYFVSDYATTNPMEDIAESFTAFITREKPKGDTIEDKKIRFFYGFDELVDMRTEMREEIKE